eukprot:1109065_1
MIDTSTIISIVYFSANILLLIILALYVQRTSEHLSIKSKAFIKYVWGLRKIFGPISTKFVTIDGKIIIADSAEHLHPQQSFPDCVNYFYVTRAAWRVFNIMTRFAIMVLMWAVLGGAWLAIWCVINWIPLVVMFKIYSRSQSVIVELGGKALVSLIGTIPYGFDQTRAIYNLIIVGYAQNIVSLAVIAVFGTVEFDCFVDICADSSTRQFVNEQGNNRMLIFFCMGSIALIFDVILFVMLRRNDLIVIG